MSKIETGGPAFPNDRHSTSKMSGMNLRDYIATKVIVALLQKDQNSYIKCAQDSYQIADDMIEARK